MAYHYPTCSKCGTQLRVPKIYRPTTITCPTCGYLTEFDSGTEQPGQRDIKGLGALVKRLYDKNASLLGFGDTGYQPNPNLASRLSNQEPTFNIIKYYGGGYIDRYFQAVAVMNNAGHTCTEINFCRLYKDSIDSICLTATLQGMGRELVSLSMLIFDQIRNIEQEFNNKKARATYDEILSINEEIRIKHKGLQAFAEEQFFKALLGQANTASNRKLIGCPFDCVASSQGKQIVNDNWSVASKEKEEDVSYIAYFEIHEGEPESSGYRPELAIVVVKTLAAQYGLNVPITEAPL